MNLGRFFRSGRLLSWMLAGVGVLVVAVLLGSYMLDKNDQAATPKLSNHITTPDMDRLHKNLINLAEVLDQIEFKFINDPHWLEPSDTSYLTDAERANPDVMANIDAMLATNKLIAWFGKDQEGGFVGLWIGPEKNPLERAPVVRLDNEGGYTLIATTVPDYIAVSDMDEKNFDTTRAALIAVGFSVTASSDEIWESRKGFSDPNAYHLELYNQGRVRRGLEKFK